MTPEEITKTIRTDLWENAYETQCKNPIAYKGKNLALGFQSGYNVCPKCKTIDNIASRKNKIFCNNCGMETTLNPYGYFPENFDFKTVEEWDDYQENFYKELVKDVLKNQEINNTSSISNETEDVENPIKNNTSLFYDTEMELWNFTENHSETCLGKGIFTMYTDKFVFETKSTVYTLLLNEIPDVSIHGRKTLIFTANGNLHYELKSKKIVNVRKYLSCYKVLKNNI